MPHTVTEDEYGPPWIQIIQTPFPGPRPASPNHKVVLLTADETAEANGLLGVRGRPNRLKRSADDGTDIELSAKVPKREDIMHNWNGIIEIIDDAEYFLPRLVTWRIREETKDMSNAAMYYGVRMKQEIQNRKDVEEKLERKNLDCEELRDEKRALEKQVATLQSSNAERDRIILERDTEYERIANRAIGRLTRYKGKLKTAAVKNEYLSREKASLIVINDDLRREVAVLKVEFRKERQEPANEKAKGGGTVVKKMTLGEYRSRSRSPNLIESCCAVVAAADGRWSRE